MESYFRLSETLCAHLKIQNCTYSHLTSSHKLVLIPVICPSQYVCRPRLTAVAHHGFPCLRSRNTDPNSSHFDNGLRPVYIMWSRGLYWSKPLCCLCYLINCWQSRSTSAAASSGWYGSYLLTLWYQLHCGLKKLYLWHCLFLTINLIWLMLLLAAIWYNKVGPVNLMEAPSCLLSTELLCSYFLN